MWSGGTGRMYRIFRLFLPRVGAGNRGGSDLFRLAESTLTRVRVGHGFARRSAPGFMGYRLNPGETSILAHVRSASVQGVESHSVSVEVNLSVGLPVFIVVGLPKGPSERGGSGLPRRSRTWDTHYRLVESP